MYDFFRAIGDDRGSDFQKNHFAVYRGWPAWLIPSLLPCEMNYLKVHSDNRRKTNDRESTNLRS
jgi:hypothetical protein